MRKLLLVLTVTALSQAASAENLVVTPSDSGKTFTLAIGQCLDVRLLSNAGSTGYQWYLAPGLSDMLSLTARTETTPGNAMPGTPVTLDYILCAAKPGQAAVTFANYRVWEKNVKPAQTLAFTVKVKP